MGGSSSKTKKADRHCHDATLNTAEGAGVGPAATDPNAVAGFGGDAVSSTEARCFAPAYEGQHVPPQQCFNPTLFQSGRAGAAMDDANRPVPSAPVITGTDVHDSVLDNHVASQREVSFDCSGKNLTSTLVNPPNNAGMITHLNFSNNDIRIIEGLQRFSRLTRLTLQGNDIREVRGLELCVHLSWLDVSSNELKSLVGLPQSQTLQALDVHDNNIKSLVGLSAPGLTYLNAGSCSLRSLDGIDGVPSIRVLDVHDNDIEHPGATLARCRYLQKVDISSNNLIDMSDFTGLDQLTELDAHDNNITSLSTMACSALKRVNLHSNSLRHIKGAQRAFPNVSTLRLSSNDIDDITELPRLAKLQSVDVRNNYISSSRLLIQVIETCRDLRVIRFEDNDISSEGERSLRSAATRAGVKTVD